MTESAPPLSELAQSGIGVAASPTGGQGLALTPAGRIPFGTLPEPWRYFADEGRHLNSWADTGTGFLRARFRKVAGIVFFEGQMQKAAVPGAPELMATLPDGYWPQNTLKFIVSASTIPVTIAEIGVASNGITFQSTTAGAGVLNVWITISFSPYVS